MNEQERARKLLVLGDEIGQGTRLRYDTEIPVAEL
jgi:hypothetical protein